MAGDQIKGRICSKIKRRPQNTGLQPFFNNRQNFGSERNGMNSYGNQPKPYAPETPYHLPPKNVNYNRNPRGNGNLDNLSMENNPSSISKAKSQRSGFENAPNVYFNFDEVK